MTITMQSFEWTLFHAAFDVCSPKPTRASIKNTVLFRAWHEMWNFLRHARRIRMKKPRPSTRRPGLFFPRI
tara:strand:- start:168 stop:380 length:213 start_codon:yes stop_codon:yes gene_type:complete